MADATPQRRVLPARERQQSAVKRRALSSTAQPTTPAEEPRVKRKYTKRASLVKPATPLAGTPTPSTPIEDALPTRVQASKPLATAAEKQSGKLSSREYQSIAESAVLAASLHRSRMQWLCEGVFKRYWTKPVKRKGVIEQPEGNPDAKSMQKLGNAVMTVEPHTFDVTFYTVKDLSSIPPPGQRHPNQHTVKHAQHVQHVQPHPPSTAPSPSPAQSVPTHKPNAAPAQAAVPATSPSVVSGSNLPVKQEPSGHERPVTLDAVSAAGSATPNPPVSAPSVSTPSRPAADPVIQMLAARAATDNRLKELMKVVAMSQATQDQLREFQGHIDEFNKIVKQQEAKKAEVDKDKSPPAPAASHPAKYNTPSRPSYPGPPTSIGGPMNMPPPPSATYPSPRPEPFIKHIVVEFHADDASTDRWLFPEHAVLDIRTGGMEMVASFFVERKGEDILRRHALDEEDKVVLGAKFQSATEYYQPVTVAIKATQHRTIETIARAAKPLADCQKHMREVMEKKSRAPHEYLVLRLPRNKDIGESDTADFVDSAVDVSNDEDDELKDFYGM